MNRSFLLATTLLGLAGCSAGPRCETVDAQGVTTALQPKAQFRAMLKSAIERTQTARTIATRDGGTAKLSDAVDASVERHHQEWERNIVSSWAMLDASELAQVCTALSRRDQAAFVKFATSVSGEAEKRNAPLLKRAGMEVLNATF